MRPFALTILIIFAIAGSIHAQRPSRTPNPKPTPVTSETRFGEIIAITDDEARLNGLLEFIKQFPDDRLVFKARESIVSARAAIADKKLLEGDGDTAVKLFTEAIESAPEPVSDELFAKVLLQIPTNLFVAGKRSEAFEAAGAIEKKVSSDARKLVGLTTFFITVQYGTEAIRLAEKAIEVDPKSTLARFTLATALRLNFRLSDAIRVYREIVVIDDESLSAKLNLAELLRATGKVDDSIPLYREVLEKNPDDPTALAGLAIALHFKGDKEASSFLEKASAADPTNGIMHATIAFHHIESGELFKALDSADRSIAASPASSWGYIAKSRAMKMTGDFDEAERLLIFARTFGDFPSLNYELASLRLELGYFREAAETIFRGYDLDEGLVISYLGNRVLADSNTFSELISLERRAVVLDSMFKMEPATESRLKNLMFFVKAISAEKSDRESVVKSGRAFIEGDDSMRLHREIFIAGRMLQRNIAVDEALAILRSAVPRVDDSLKPTMSAPATLADDIYEARQSAFSRGERIFTPRATEQVLGSVLRGRLEELTGLAFLLSDDAKQAVIRFRRAVSVLPEKSAWWNSAQWRLGNALEADGNPADAAEAYIKTYDPANPDELKYAEIERLWISLKRNPAALIERIGERPSANNSDVATTSQPDVEKKAASSILPEDVPLTIGDRNPSVKDEKKSIETASTPSPDKKIESTSSVESEKPLSAETKSSVIEEKPIAKPDDSPKMIPATEPKKEGSPFDSIIISSQKIDGDAAGKSATTCRLIASPSLITLSTDGTATRIGVSSFGGNHRDISATSSSINDVAIAIDESVKDDAFKKFFSARSTSGNPGVFKITFTSPCGSKDVEIRVK